MTFAFALAFALAASQPSLSPPSPLIQPSLATLPTKFKGTALGPKCSQHPSGQAGLESEQGKLRKRKAETPLQRTPPALDFGFGLPLPLAFAFAFAFHLPPVAHSPLRRTIGEALCRSMPQRRANPQKCFAFTSPLAASSTFVVTAVSSCRRPNEKHQASWARAGNPTERSSLQRLL